MQSQLAVERAPARVPGALVAELARSSDEVRASQRLRYEIFAGELGANLHNFTPGLDHDRFDPFCQHLLVRDTATGAVVGSTRVLTEEMARLAGGFYSEGEFDLSRLLETPGRFMEIGRTCIHRDYRSGATIAVLWAGLAKLVAEYRVDHLIGCASVGLDEHPHAAAAYLNERYLTAESQRVWSRYPLPAQPAAAGDVRLPPLLKAYLRVGAQVCGDPYLDIDFRVADFLILLATSRLEKRYARHYLG